MKGKARFGNLNDSEIIIIGLFEVCNDFFDWVKNQVPILQHTKDASTTSCLQNVQVIRQCKFFFFLKKKPSQSVGLSRFWSMA